MSSKTSVHKWHIRQSIIFHRKDLNVGMGDIEFENVNHKFPVMYVTNDFSWTERFDKISSFKCWFSLIKSDSL